MRTAFRVLSHTFPLLSLVVLCLCSCSSARDENKKENSTGDREFVSLPGAPIPPNTCRLIGTIVAVDSTLQPAKAGDPCSKVPCVATIRVDSLIGYGPAFARPLVSGDQIRARFAFTLRPSREQFPEMTESYPGLGPGSHFLVDVRSEPTPAMASPGGVVFVVYGYEVR